MLGHEASDQLSVEELRCPTCSHQESSVGPPYGDRALRPCTAERLRSPCGGRAHDHACQPRRVGHDSQPWRCRNGAAPDIHHTWVVDSKTETRGTSTERRAASSHPAGSLTPFHGDEPLQLPERGATHPG